MAAMIQNDVEKEWMLPLLELRNSLDFRSGSDPSRNPEDSDRHLRDFRRMTGAVQVMDSGREIPGPYTQEARETWLRKAACGADAHSPNRTGGGARIGPNLKGRAAGNTPHLGHGQT